YALVPRSRVRPFVLPDTPQLRVLLRRQALANLVPDVVVTTTAVVGIDPFPSVALDGAVDDLWQRVRGATARAAAAAVGASGGKPRLAYVSPLPPEKSGIADYSAELVPELAAYYDVELIVEQERVSDARVERFPQRSAAWLREHAATYDRVLYHFGNS
ncbi:hypothetical protein DVK02_18330, partial [Halobellus sp. Atlit-31R]